jgi:eukaryotic translation initiation factor 2C
MFGILVGGKEKAIVFPAEVCTIIEGQIYKKKVPPESTPEVVKFATSKPDQRLATIQQGGGGLRAPVSKDKYEIQAVTPFIGLRVPIIAFHARRGYASITDPHQNRRARPTDTYAGLR